MVGTTVRKVVGIGAWSKLVAKTEPPMFRFSKSVFSSLPNGLQLANQEVDGLFCMARKPLRVPLKMPPA